MCIRDSLYPASNAHPAAPTHHRGQLEGLFDLLKYAFKGTCNAVNHVFTSVPETLQCLLLVRPRALRAEMCICACVDRCGVAAECTWRMRLCKTVARYHRNSAWSMNATPAVLAMLYTCLGMSENLLSTTDIDLTNRSCTRCQQRVHGRSGASKKS